jgi:hypothetical protein
MKQGGRKFGKINEKYEQRGKPGVTSKDKCLMLRNGYGNVIGGRSAILKEIRNRSLQNRERTN